MEYGALLKWNRQGKIELFRVKYVPVTVCPLQVSYKLVCDGSRDSTVQDRWLATSDMVQFPISNSLICYSHISKFTLKSTVLLFGKVLILDCLLFVANISRNAWFFTSHTRRVYISLTNKTECFFLNFLEIHYIFTRLMWWSPESKPRRPSTCFLFISLCVQIRGTETWYKLYNFLSGIQFFFLLDLQI